MGADAFHKTSNTTVDGTTLILVPEPTNLSYAIYEFSLENSTWDGRVEFDITFITGEDAWIGWSDYNQDSWEFHQLTPGESFIELGPGQWLSSAQCFYFAVLALDLNSVLISSVRLPVVQYEWEIHVVDTGVHPDGADTSLALLDGKPAVAYNRENEVAFARSTTSAPSSSVDWIKSDVESLTWSGLVSLKVIEGKPMVAYGLFSPHFARSITNEPAAPTDWLSMTLYSWDIVNLSNLVEVAGKPAFVTWSGHGGDLGFSRIDYYYASIAEPSVKEQWVCKSVRGGFYHEYQFPWLVEQGGMPALCWREYDATMFSRATTVTPENQSDWPSIEVDAGPGNNHSVILLGERPAISYGEVAISNVAFPASSADFEFYANEGLDTSPRIAVVNDLPAFVYWDGNTGAVRLRWWWSTSPASWEWTTYIVEDGLTQASGISLVDQEGMPIITYCDVTSTDIKFARLVES